MLLVFLNLSTMFVYKYRSNKEMMSRQIFIYSRMLFPTLKYLYSENRMAQSNTETVYFCLGALTFFLWSFLAGLLLKLEDRYIGISLTAATVSVVYLYVIARIKSSMFLL